jgi:hypothetical protein
MVGVPKKLPEQLAESEADPIEEVQAQTIDPTLAVNAALT